MMRQAAALALLALRVALVAAAMAFGSAGSSVARDMTAVERTALDATVERFNSAMGEADYNAVAATIPPKVLQHIADIAGLDVGKLREMVVAQMEAALAVVKIESFSMDMAKLEQRTLPSGEPFALIPSVTKMDTGRDRITANSHTLALLDGGSWYLLRIEEAQQLAILRQVYPEFSGVELPSGKAEASKD